MLKPEKIIILVSTILFLASFYLYQRELIRVSEQEKELSKNFIGLVIRNSGDVKIRFGDSISWKKLEQKSRIYTGAYIYTGENASTIIALLDHSTITLKENSLIFIDHLTDVKSVQRIKEQRLDPLQLKYYGGIAVIETKDKTAINKVQVDSSRELHIKEKAKLILEEKKKEIEDLGIIEKRRNISLISGNVQITKKGVPGEKRLERSKTKQSHSKNDITNEIEDEIKKIELEEKRKLFISKQFKDRNNFKVLIQRIKRHITKLLYRPKQTKKKESSTFQN